MNQLAGTYTLRHYVLRNTFHVRRPFFYFELRMGYNEMERETSDSLAARIAAEVYDGNN
jgi:hypothetical protein